MNRMIPRYQQILCVISLTLMMGCDDKPAMLEDDAMVSGDISNGVTASTEMSLSSSTRVDNITTSTITSPPVDITSPPVDITSPPVDITSPPVDITSPPVIDSTPIEDADCLDFSLGQNIWEGNVIGIPDLIRVGSGSYTAITGSLVLSERDEALTSIDLPQLQTVCGDVIIIDNISLASIDLPQLQTVGRLVKIVAHTNSLESVDLPQLKTVNRVEIFGNAKLTSINLPRLQTANETSGVVVWINGNKFLESISMPQLETSRSVSIARNTRLNKHHHAKTTYNRWTF